MHATCMKNLGPKSKFHFQHKHYLGTSLIPEVVLKFQRSTSKNLGVDRFSANRKLVKTRLELSHLLVIHANVA